MLNSLFGLFSTDLAIDLGTANILVYMKGKGIVVNEPSIVAIHKNHREKGGVLAIGVEAQRMLGKTPENIITVRPIKDGVIADFDVCRTMLLYFIRKVHNQNKLVRPRVIIGVPSSITHVEKRAVRESAESARAREVYIIEEPIAAAIGAGMPIMGPSGNMIVVIGGGTTEVAVISLGGLVKSQSVRVAGDKMNEAVVQYMKRRHNLLIGERTGELVKMALGGACPGQAPDEKEDSILVKGRDLDAGIPKTITVQAAEIRESLQEHVNTIIRTVKNVLEETPPELVADILNKGIVLAGGGALLRNLDILLQEATGLPVRKADDPLSCVAIGAGMVLDNIEILSEVCS